MNVNNTNIFTPALKQMILDLIKSGKKPMFIHRKLVGMGHDYQLRQVQDICGTLRRENGLQKPRSRTEWERRQQAMNKKPVAEKRTFDKHAHHASRHYQGNFEL